MINSRKLEDLDPIVRDIAREHIRGCRDAGIELLVTSTYRDAEAQADLYAIGRTKDLDRKPVTNAKPGRSWHNFKCAYDVVPVVGGKAVWNDEVLWREIIRIGKAVGAEAGAEWKTFPDKPHFQRKPDPKMTLAQAQELFLANGTIFVA